jgi:hypothetical protein
LEQAVDVAEQAAAGWTLDVRIHGLRCLGIL